MRLGSTPFIPKKREIYIKSKIPSRHFNEIQSITPNGASFSTILTKEQSRPQMQLNQSLSFELFPSTSLIFPSKSKSHSQLDISQKIEPRPNKEKIKLLNEDLYLKMRKVHVHAESDKQDLKKLMITESFSHPKSLELFKAVKRGDFLNVKALVEAFPDLKKATDDVIFK